MNIRNRNRCSWLSIITNRISSRYIILYDYKSYYNRYDLSMIFIPIIIFLNMENIGRPSREKRCWPAEWWADSVKKIESCERVSDGWRRGVSCWRPECVLAGLISEAKVPTQAFKVVPRLQHRRRLRSVSWYFRRFLPAGFVFHRFRHIVNDTNYKERGIFYG